MLSCERVVDVARDRWAIALVLIAVVALAGTLSGGFTLEAERLKITTGKQPKP